MTWSDSAEYLAEVEKFLAPLQGSVFWDKMWWALTDIEHFQYPVWLIQPYISVADKCVLDSGCGVGGLVITLHQSGAAEIVGVELDDDSYKLAALRTLGIGGIRIVHDDAALRKLAPGSFDIIFSMHVIEHVADSQTYLQTQAQLLRPGGILLLACPNRFWPLEAHSGLPLLHYFPRRLSKRWGVWLEQNVHLPRMWRDRGRTSTLYESDFNGFRLKRLLKAQGFEILELNHPAHVWSGQVARRLQRLPSRWQHHLSMFFTSQLIAVCRRQ
jgi:2-polyprenyl-3-methyl-5-hydroxy-6-metoxy-1,4-benzoquinol methylase